MLKLLTFLIALGAVAFGVCSPASAQIIGGGVWGDVKPHASPSTTTWDPSNYNSANLTLSGGNLTITRSTIFDGNVYSGRSIASHSSGKFYAEFTAINDNQNAIGFCNSTFTFSTSLTNSLNALAITDNGNIFVNGGGIGAGAPFTSGSVVGIAIDFGSSLIWFRVGSGSWNSNPSANPATGAGRISWAGLNAGPYYAATEFVAAGAGTTADFGASAYANAAPVGFGNW